MSANIESAIEHTMWLEGKFSNNKDDSGGATKYGVTEATARAKGYLGRMEDMPIEFARDVVYPDYWNRAWEALESQAVANELFDTRINAFKVSDAIAQAAVNSLNMGGTLYPNIHVDGSAGPKTVDALNILIRRGDEAVLLKVMNRLQGAYYIASAAGEDAKAGWFAMVRGTAGPTNEKNETFMRGWINKRT